MRQKHWMIVAAAAVIAAGNVWADHSFSIRWARWHLWEVVVGCPFCSAPSLTMAEQLAQSDAILLVKWIGGKPATGSDGGTTELEILDIVRQPTGGGLKRGGTISLARYRAAKTGTLFALLGTKAGATIDWGSPIEVTNDSFAYMKNAPAPDVEPKKRLKYFLQYLDSADPMISADAYGEFANAQYADIAAIAPQFPREKLQKWVADPHVSPSRLGLYGLMLGLCGRDEDALILEKKVLETSGEFRVGIDGVMGGYLLLTREAGLKKLEEAMMINKQAQFSDTYAAMQALRFMWQYGDDRISKDRLRQSMRLLLERPELADMVIADLARWQDWSVQGRLMELYGAEEYDIPSIKRAIVRYMLASTKDGAKPAEQGSAAAEPPPHVLQGQKYLAELEQKDPKTVADAKRFYFIK